MNDLAAKNAERLAALRDVECKAALANNALLDFMLALRALGIETHPLLDSAIDVIADEEAAAKDALKVLR